MYNQAAAEAKDFLDEDRQEFYAADTIDAFIVDMDLFYGTAKAADEDF